MTLLGQIENNYLPLAAGFSEQSVAALSSWFQHWLNGDRQVPSALLLAEDEDPALVSQQLGFEPATNNVPDDYTETFLLVRTTGSTSTPKLVALTSKAVKTSVQATHEALAGPGQWVLALPPHHIAGAMVVARSLLAGFSPVVCARPQGNFDLDEFSKATTTALQQTRSTNTPIYTALVPRQIEQILSSSVATASARKYQTILVGGAAMSKQLAQEAKQAGLILVTTYGSSETCGGCVYDRKALPGVKLKVDETGRLLINSPTLMTGYVNASTDWVTDEMGKRFLPTSDLAEIDCEGRLSILGRADWIINTGGEKVNPLAVEARLIDHPQITAAVVVGLPDPTWGEKVCALIVPARQATPNTDPAQNDTTLDLRQIRDWVTTTLGKPCAPKEILLVSQVPTKGIGKLDREAAKRLARQNLPAEDSN
ncbi:hypothetical protein BK816_07550 [Boudabousia tangfeifanii]|uniref:AMP-dependent synthetase/ligase domain-containing protein n=1 Tax=Boudabousia tangfeifanii TaxID=1912795 RepID=A0A1D9MLL4_9ACTO|nr:AMP-binding protein [Boudabousia tangfeifanii]AOZ73165.1 hypothetical protein BK816_07550 [Boudabousia tangfeifanii]